MILSITTEELIELLNEWLFSHLLADSLKVMCEENCNLSYEVSPQNIRSGHFVIVKSGSVTTYNIRVLHLEDSDSIYCNQF